MLYEDVEDGRASIISSYKSEKALHSEASNSNALEQISLTIKAKMTVQGRLIARTQQVEISYLFGVFKKKPYTKIAVTMKK